MCAQVLREDGGFEYKKAIVDSILILIREIPDAKESGLAHLCEFIEVPHPPTPPFSEHSPELPYFPLGLQKSVFPP